MNWCLIIGILLNSSLIVINRFVCKLPGKVHIPLLIVAVALLVAGIVQSGRFLG